MTSGTFTIPTTGETSANVWYRIYLTVRDSAGATQTVQRDVLPRKVTLTLATTPAGLQLRLDGQPIATPTSFEAVVGIVRALEAARPDVGNGRRTSSCPGPTAAPPRTTSARPRRTRPTPQRSAQAATGGSGLSATYFNNADFSGTTVTRIDPGIDFTWGTGSPAPAIDSDTFSARWTGQVEAPYSGTYTFYTVSDDGVRLWVNGVQLVNHWSNHGAYEDRGTIALTAGQRYSIRMEYYENGGSATARLLWSHASIAKAPVPASRLFPATSAASTMWYSSQNTRKTRTSSRAASAAACCWLRIGSERSSDGWPVFARNLKDVTGCTTPSSRTSKSSAVSVLTGRPLRSMTVASTLTVVVPLRNGCGGCWSWDIAASCEAQQEQPYRVRREPGAFGAV